MNMTVEETIRSFIAREILYSGEGFAFSDEVSFLQEGIIDSMGVMEIVAFIEKQFGVRPEAHEIVPENFDSVKRLAAYVRRKQEAV
jgi:acyl carrier protein